LNGLLDPLGLGIITGDVDATAEEIEADTAAFTLMGQKFDPLAGYAYLLFVLIYFPCVAAFGATVQEMGPSLESFWLLISQLSAGRLPPSSIS
jgi:ferrous iron transport protein B